MMAVERRFLDDWSRAWQLSEAGRRRKYYELNEATLARVQSKRKGCGSTLFRCDATGPHFIKPGGVNEPRVADRSCSFRSDSLPMQVPDQAWGVTPDKRKIASAENDKQWVCPNWLPPDDYYLSMPRLPDERLGIDAALDPAFKPLVQRQRRILTAEFAEAVRVAPRENVLVGQLIRFLVDAGDLNRALTSARACVAERWWCQALSGYVHHRRGEIQEADVAFGESMKLVAPADRCRLTSIGMLLDPDARRAYLKSACAQRDSLNDVVWWLADPLWSVPGNDRRTEQFARRVMIDLHAATGRDERYNWTPLGGGDALAEMVARYGWMSYASVDTPAKSIRFPASKPPEYGFAQLYQPKPSGPPLPDPIADARALGGLQTTFEYSIGRVRVVPPWSMIADPFSVKNSDWSMNAPSGDLDFTMGWWPQEHYVPLHPLIDIPDQQVAFLRRDTVILIGYATSLSQTDLTRRLGDSVRVVLLASAGPPDARILAERRVESPDRLTFLAPLPSGPSMVSVEIPWDDAGRRAARSRFGVKPLAPLSSMSAGSTAISDPVLLVVPANTTELPLLADSAIALMRGSTVLSRGTNAIGVYWETYGFDSSDSVDVTVSIQRRSEGLLERLGAAAGVTGDPNAQVTASWKEPQRGRPVRTVAGAVPIQMRSVVLNIATLPAGTYTLTVAVGKFGSEPVKGAREFIVR
jgi:hypothetical protein